MVFEEACREEIDVAGGVVEGGQPLPGIPCNVARWLVPIAGPLHAASLGNRQAYK